MEIDVIARAAINRDIADLNRVRADLERVRRDRETQVRFEARVAQERRAEEEQRILDQVRDFREDRRAVLDDQRRLERLDRDDADIRRETRLDRIADDIQTANAEARAAETDRLAPAGRDGEVVAEAAPPRDDAAAARQAPADGDRFFEELRARDQRLADRAAEDRAFLRQQALDQARAERNLRQTTQPDADASRGALVDLQA